MFWNVLRFFPMKESLSLELFSPGSIIANLQVNLLSHPQAECYFMSRIHTLNSFFPGGSFGRNTCEIEFHSIFQIIHDNTLKVNINGLMSMIILGENKFTVTSIEPTVGPKSGGRKLSTHHKLFSNFFKVD